MKKNILVNAALLMGSVLFTFAILEVAIIKLGFITKTPLKFHFALPPAIALLTQTSKEGVIPKNYVALIGDSYAKGNGDWLLGANPNSNGPFHTAHVLHDLTGYDVFSFGKSGASNIKGWVREPSSLYPFIHDVIDPSIEKPDVILAYFYAGNDLLDNLLQLQSEFIPEYGEAALNEDAAWDAYLEKMIRKNKVGPYRNLNTTFGWLIGSAGEIIKENIKPGKPNKSPAITETHEKTENRIAVNGVDTLYPYDFEGPGLGLTPNETDMAFIALTKSLQHLKRDFPDSKIVIVYIPSPAESYAISSERISVLRLKDLSGDMVRATFYRDELSHRSAEIASRLAAEAAQQHVGFIDTRDDMKAAGMKEIIHGPKDSVHYNESGYNALGRSIACHMAKSGLWKASVCPESPNSVQ